MKYPRVNFSEMRATLAIGLVGACVLVSCSHKKPPPAAASLGPPDAVATDTSSAEMSVYKINAAKRAVAMKRADGSTRTYVCGEGVDPDQFHQGQSLNVIVIDEIAIYTKKPTDAPHDTTSASPTTLAADTGVLMSNSADVTATLGPIDAERHTITLNNLAGKTTMIRVDPKANLVALHEGDDVIVRCVQSLRAKPQAESK